MNKFSHPDQATDATAENEMTKPVFEQSVLPEENNNIAMSEENNLLLLTDESTPVQSEPLQEEAPVQELTGIQENSVSGNEVINSIPANSEHLDAAEDKEELLDELDELHTPIAFHELSRVELLAALKELLPEENPDLVKHKFAGIREAFYRVKEEETAAKRLKFIENGGASEDFEIQSDETDEQFGVSVKAFLEKKAAHRRQKEKELQDNLKRKKEILEELKDLCEPTENTQAAFDRLHDLQAEWRSIGLVPASYIDELWKNYHHHINNFYDVIKINKELRELDYKRNLELKTALCIKAEELFLEASIKKSLDDYKLLQDEWKQIGQANREQNEIIWERFKAAGDKLFDRRREFMLAQDRQFSENLESKMKLIAQTEELVSGLPFPSHQTWIEASDKMAVLLEEWKKTGFAGKKDNEPTWKRFRELRDRFYQAKEEFYKSLRESQAHNYKLKVDLCMEAEALKDSTDWKKSGERMRELQEQWKKTGAVSKKHTEKLWQRFRSACDAFYQHRKEFFSEINQNQEENLRRKLDLIDRIQKFEQGDDAQANFEALKSFQAEWLEIGHVTLKEKDQVQKDYRSAIDKQFAQLKAGNADMRRQMFRTQVQNIKQQPGGKDKLSQQKFGLQDKIRKIQTEIQTWENNIGFLGRSKAADTLKLEIQKKIERAKADISSLMDQLRILKEE